MIGLVILAFIVSWLIASWISYNKGIKLTGHICKTEPILPGVRYQVVPIKMVEIHCLQCAELIPSQIIVKRTFKESAKMEPYTVELDLTDYKVHAIAHQEAK